MGSRLDTFVGLLDLSAVPKPKEQPGTITCAEEISTDLGHVSPRCPLQTYALRFRKWLQWIPIFRTENGRKVAGGYRDKDTRSYSPRSRNPGWLSGRRPRGQ